MRKLSICLTTVLVAVFCLGLFPAEAFTPNVEVHSDAVYMVNMDTGEVVYEKNAEKQKYPASLTKIMTAIVVMENIPDLENTMVTAEPQLFDEFVGINISHADFRHGEIASAKDYLYAMMLQSACEAASALAYHVGEGDMDKFVQMMNDKAKEIGAVNTHFVNAHGLFDPNQYTTAKDMYLIASYAAQIPGFMEIAKTPRYSIPASNKHSEPRWVLHTNLMLDQNRGGKYYYSYAEGIKTGTLDEAGRCLVSTANKDGNRYMIVSLDAPIYDSYGTEIADNLSFIDHKGLYEWAFDFLRQQTLLQTGEEVGEVKVRNSFDADFVKLQTKEDFIATFPKDIELSTIQRVIRKEDSVSAPVKAGDKLGEIDLKFEDEVIATIDLVATDDVNRSTFLYILSMIQSFFTSTWFKITIAVVILLVVLYIVIIMYYNQKKRKLKRIRKSRRL